MLLLRSLHILTLTLKYSSLTLSTMQAYSFMCRNYFYEITKVTVKTICALSPKTTKSLGRCMYLWLKTEFFTTTTTMMTMIIMVSVDDDRANLLLCQFFREPHKIIGSRSYEMRSNLHYKNSIEYALLYRYSLYKSEGDFSAARLIDFHFCGKFGNNHTITHQPN